jgi:hypothetical protein
MKMKILLLLLLLLVPSGRLQVQEIRDCMCPPLSYPRTGQLINGDSSLVFDTCGVWYPSANCDSAYWNNINSTYGDTAMSRVYAKKYWDVKFDVPAILLDSVRGDSLLFVTQNAIDSINYPNLKYGFNQLEIKYGTYRLRKVAPHLTTGKGSQYFNLYFDNYAPMGEVWYTLDTMEHVYCEFKGWPPITQNDVIDFNNNIDCKITFESSQKTIKIQTNKFTKTYNIEIFNLLGNRYYYNDFSSNNKFDEFNIDINSYPSGLFIIAINKQIYKFLIFR